MALYSNTQTLLSNLLSDIKDGSLSVPDLQRPFVWDKTKVRDLLDSMMKGYPVGYIMTWEPLENREKSRQVGVHEHSYDRPSKLILDGQQRLTGLYAAMYGVPIINKKFKEERITISFNPLTRQFEVANSAILKNADWISDISPYFTGTYRKINEEYFQRLKAKRAKDGQELSAEEEDKIASNIDELKELRKYVIPVLEVNKDADESMVSDIFVRVNSGGMQLKEGDFILTLISVHWVEGRKLIETFCQNAQTAGTAEYNPLFNPDTIHIIRTVMTYGFKRGRLRYAYMLLRGKDLDTGVFSEEKQEEMFEQLKESVSTVLHLENWKEFMKCLQTAGYVNAKMISSQNAIAYCYALYLIGKHTYKVDQKTLRNLIARWTYMSLVTGRYTNSPESMVEQDLADMRSVTTAEEFKEYIDRKIAAQFTEDYFNITIPENLATSASNSPAWNGYCAALSVLSANTLFSSLPIRELFQGYASGNKSSLERHHLFPKNYLSNIGVAASREQNRIANMAYIEWSDNIQISDTAPSEYFPQVLAGLNYSEKEIKDMYHFHALPDGWEKMEYLEFLDSRQKLIGGIIKEGYEKLAH